MNHNSYKSIISALAGAAFVLLCAIAVLSFIIKEEPESQAAKTKEKKSELDSTEGKKAIVQAHSEAENKATVEESKPVIFNDQEIVNELVRVDIPAKKVESRANDIDIAPLVEVFENKELSKADEIFTESRPEIEKPKFEQGRTTPVDSVKRTVIEKKVGSKSITPEKNDSVTDVKPEISNKTSMELLLDESHDFLKTSIKVFDSKWLKIFGAIWTDNLKSSARSVEEIRFNSVTSTETIFSFRNKQLSKISMMIYNKGDDDLISERVFNSIKAQALSSLEAHIGKKPLFKPNAGVAKNNIYFWVHNNHLYKLEYGTSKSGKIFIGEYIRIVVTKGNSKINVINIDKASSDVLTEAELRAMVSRKNGDVLINGIPMVDQGAKGYCACAALARLMTYFGRDIDQHDIAKLAGSNADNGTEPDQLKKAVESMSAKLRLNMKILAKPYLSNERDAFRLQTKLGALVGKMENKDLKSVYNRFAYDDSRYKEFEKNVINSIDSGRPVSWALSLGIVPEPEIPQATGGHMRIITGYNRAKKLIYYTDTWGAGHEKKSMDMATAFYISLALWEISPR